MSCINGSLQLQEGEEEEEREEGRGPGGRRESGGGGPGPGSDVLAWNRKRSGNTVAYYIMSGESSLKLVRCRKVVPRLHQHLKCNLGYIFCCTHSKFKLYCYIAL